MLSSICQSMAGLVAKLLAEVVDSIARARACTELISRRFLRRIIGSYSVARAARALGAGPVS